MKKFLSGFLTAVLLPVVIVIGVLLFQPQIRHAAFRIAAEMPAIGTYFLIRRHVIARRFEPAARLLNRQMDVVAWTSPGQNALLPGLVENTEYVIERAYFADEYAALRPYLARLAEAYPDLLPARIWYARALAGTDAVALFEQLEAAWRLTSADERSYRLAMEAAIRLGLPEKLDLWCERYRKGQFGGPHPYDYNTLFFGLGLRKMALEVTDAGGGRVLLPNRGLQLGESRDYEFAFPEPKAIAGLRLFVGAVPGISIQFGGLRFFRAGREQRMPASLVRTTSRRGFQLDDSRLLIAGRDGEVITLHPPAEGFGEADKVVLNLRFERLALAGGACRQREGRQ